MTVNELIEKFNTEFGMKEWPKTYEVDAETYGYCCQAAFDWYVNHGKIFLVSESRFIIKLLLGQHSGLFLKNVELILKRKDEDA